MFVRIAVAVNANRVGTRGGIVAAKAVVAVHDALHGAVARGVGGAVVEKGAALHPEIVAAGEVLDVAVLQGEGVCRVCSAQVQVATVWVVRDGLTCVRAALCLENKSGRGEAGGTATRPRRRGTRGPCGA